MHVEGNVEMQAENLKCCGSGKSDSPSIISWHFTGLYKKVGEVDESVVADVQLHQNP